MYIAAGGLGLKQSGLAMLVRQGLGPEMVGVELVQYHFGSAGMGSGVGSAVVGPVLPWRCVGSVTLRSGGRWVEFWFG